MTRRPQSKADQLRPVPAFRAFRENHGLQPFSKIISNQRPDRQAIIKACPCKDYEISWVPIPLSLQVRFGAGDVAVPEVYRVDLCQVSVRSAPLTRATSSMHLLGGVQIKRAVLILLIVRVVAAPIALRPTPNPTRSGVIVRICSWPAQQIRSTSGKLTVGETSITPEMILPHAGPPQFTTQSSPGLRQTSALALFALRSIAPLRC